VPEHRRDVRVRNVDSAGSTVLTAGSGNTNGDIVQTRPRTCVSGENSCDTFPACGLHNASWTATSSGGVTVCDNVQPKGEHQRTRVSSRTGSTITLVVTGKRSSGQTPPEPAERRRRRTTNSGQGASDPNTNKTTSAGDTVHWVTRTQKED